MFLKTLIGIVICKKVSYFFQEISSHNHNIMYVCTSHVKFSFCLKVNRHDNFNSSILLDDVNFAFQVKFRNKFVPLKFKYIYSKTIIIHRRFLVCFSHMNIKEKKKKILPPYKDSFKKEIFLRTFVCIKKSHNFGKRFSWKLWNFTKKIPKLKAGDFVIIIHRKFLFTFLLSNFYFLFFMWEENFASQRKSFMLQFFFFSFTTSSRTNRISNLGKFA